MPEMISFGEDIKRTAEAPGPQPVEEKVMYPTLQEVPMKIFGKKDLVIDSQKRIEIVCRIKGSSYRKDFVEVEVKEGKSVGGKDASDSNKG